jgi:hypothetical protein
MARWRREPIFLHVRAVKPAGKPGVAPGFLGQSVP